MYRLLLISLSLITFFACQQNPTTPTTTPETTTPEPQPEIEKNWQLNTSDGLNIHHPADWEVDVSGAKGSKFILLLPKEEGDDYQENIMLTAQDKPSGSVALKSIGEKVASQLTKSNPALRVSMQQVSPDGAYYEMAYLGPQGNYELMNYQRVYLAKSSIYKLTYTGNKGDFSKNLHIAQESMDTFSFP